MRKLDDGLGLLGRPVLDAGTRQRKFLPDEDARLAAEAVEDVFLEDGPAPDAEAGAAHVAIELDEPAVFVVAAVGIAGARRDPVGALQKDRRAVDLAYPGLGVFRRALAREPADAFEPHDAVKPPRLALDAGLQAERVGLRGADAVGPPRLHGNVVEENVEAVAREAARTAGEFGGAVKEHNGDLADLGGRHDERIGLQRHLDAARAVIGGERRAGMDGIDRALRRALEAEGVPDADGDDSGRPIPTVAVAGLEMARVRRVTNLALLGRWDVEDDTELMCVAVGQGAGQLEQMRR